jgi:drug/metabolite transporter (DMT)-like permease
VPSFFRSPAAAYILLPTAAGCWAGNHIIARAIAGHVPPASLSVVRWLVVALILGAIGPHLLITDWRKIKAGFGALAFLALIGGAAFGTMQYVALHYTTAINMGVVGSVSPAFIVAASFLLFGDRMSLRQLFGVAVSLVGVLAIVTQLQPGVLWSLSFNEGDLMIIANMVLWSIYSACLRLRPEVHTLSFLFIFALISGVANIPFAVWEYAVGYRLQANEAALGAILYAALFSTILGYVCWNRGIELIGAPRASAFLHTIPLFSAGLATSLLGESLRLYHVAGFALILAGVTLAARPARPQEPQPQPALYDGRI